jgi:hypothetical protein
MADSRDSQHMEDALKMARQAMLHGETPIGAVLVKDGIVIATGETGVARNGPASHGENSMIESLGHKIWELAPYSTVYTNLEPCIMCIGACINAGIRHIVYGMSVPDGGGYALESINSRLTTPLVIEGPIAENSNKILLTEYLKTSNNQGGIEYVQSVLKFNGMERPR